MIGFHPHGHGAIHGLDAFVSRDSLLDKNCAVRGQSHVFNSSVMSGSSVLDSQIARSQVWHSLVMDSIVHHTTMLDITLNSVVVEDAKLYGPWELSAPIHINGGTWSRPPRHHLIKGENGVEVGLAEGLNGIGLMACYAKPLEKWLKYGPRLGQKHHWTPQQVEEARQFFQMLLDEPLPLN